MSSLSCQEMELECIRTLGEEILSSCHADSVITIKSWISVTKTRFEEVSTEFTKFTVCAMIFSSLTMQTEVKTQANMVL